MNILQICSYYIGSKLYSELFSHLEKRDIVQEIFIPVNYDSLIGANAIDESEKIKLYYSKNFNTLDRFLYWRKVNKITADLLEYYKEMPDLSHAHSLFVNGGVALKLKEKKSIPYIVEVQNTDINIFFKYFFHLRKQGFKILEEAEKIVFYSPAYKDQIANMAPENTRGKIIEKSVVIGSGVHDFWFENKAQEKTLNRDDINIIYMGIIDKNKNIISSIKAIEKLREKGKNINYTIIGKEKDKKTMNMIKNRDWIKYIPYLPKEELIDYVRANDIYLMPSHTETFGLVYVEAMTQGLPIIYSKDQGFDGQGKEGEIGFSVNSKSIEDIAEGIEKVIADYEGISKRALDFSESFSWTAICDKYENLYKEIEEI